MAAIVHERPGTPESRGAQDCCEKNFWLHLLVWSLERVTVLDPDAMVNRPRLLPAQGRLGPHPPAGSAVDYAVADGTGACRMSWRRRPRSKPAMLRWTGRWEPRSATPGS